MKSGIFFTDNEMQFRILGSSSSLERVGSGFLQKSRHEDVKNQNVPVYSLVYVLKGEGVYVDHNDRKHLLRKGDYFQRIPGYIHSNYINTDIPWQECFIALGPHQARALIEMGFINPDQPVGSIDNHGYMIQKITELTNMIRNATDSDLPTIFKTIMNLLIDILEMNNIKQKKDQDYLLIQNVCTYIAENACIRMDLPKLAQLFNVGYQKLRKDFKKRMGISLGSYWIRKRIEACFKLLNDPALTIGEIAELAGYKSIYDFSSQFKKLTGHPPSYYRTGVE